MKRLEHICTEEKVKYEKEALETAVTCSEGDLRKAITYLQVNI